MSDMKFEKPLTPKHLVDNNLMLNVPVYQRLFVWKSSQILKLLSDLYDSRNKGLYNIGIISVWINAKENNNWEIVDGQQRLTFLSLFAAWAVANLGAESSSRKKWCDFLFTGEKLRLHFIGRPEDEKAIKALAAGKMPLSGSFRLFAETANAFFANRIGLEALDARESFVQYVYENCAFLTDTLPDGYGPYELNLYFEKMNSTGRQLEPIDMVKGIYFSHFAQRWNTVFRADEREFSEFSITEIISDAANDDSNNPTTSTGNKDDVELEMKRLISDEVLLLHSLRIASEDESVLLDNSRLLEMFGKYFNGNPEEDKEKAQRFIEVLEGYSLWMNKHIIRITKDEKHGATKYVFSSDNDECADNEEHLSNYDAGSMKPFRSRKLKQFESMLYVSSDDSQAWILKAYSKAEKKDIDDEKLLDVLKAIDSDNAKMAHPFPEQPTLDAHGLSYGQIDRYWFWKLDYLLWERHEDCPSDALFSKCNGIDDARAIAGYVFRRDRSIEHLHPQNPPDGSEQQDWADDDASHNDEIRNGFGNLAMISSSFNSAQSNDSISTKMGRINDQVRENRLQSIKLLLMVRSVESDPMGWSVKAAKRHGEAMLKLLYEEMGNAEIIRRRRILETLTQRPDCSGFSLRYYSADGKRMPIGMLHEPDTDWFVWDWLSVFVEKGRYAIELSIDRKCQNYEIGIARLTVGDAETLDDRTIESLSKFDSTIWTRPKDDQYWHVVHKDEVPTDKTDDEVVDILAAQLDALQQAVS